MSTRAAVRQRTHADEYAPPHKWRLSISSANHTLTKLDGVVFEITQSVPAPTGQMTEFEGSAGQIPFLGYYNSERIVSFSLKLDAVLYTFFGVFSPTANVISPMAGVIISSGADELSAAGEDEGSWSSQAPPRPEDDNRARRKTVVTKKRA